MACCCKPSKRGWRESSTTLGFVFNEEAAKGAIMRRLLQQHGERSTKRTKYYQDTGESDKENNYTTPAVNFPSHPDKGTIYVAPVTNFPGHPSSQYLAADALPHHVPNFVAANHIVAHSYGTPSTNSSFFTSSLTPTNVCAPTVRDNNPDNVAPLHTDNGVEAPRGDVIPLVAWSTVTPESAQLPSTLETVVLDTFPVPSSAPPDSLRPDLSSSHFSLDTPGFGSFTEMLLAPPAFVVPTTITASPGTDPSPTPGIERTKSFKENFQLVSLHESKKSAGVSMRTRDTYVYVYHYNYGKKDNLKRVEYRCASHENCAFRYRVGVYKPVDPHPILEQQMFALEQQGQHNGRPTGRSQYGINPSVKDEVDSLASGGAGPKKILKVLAMKYSGQRNVLGNIPTAEQIKSRKNYLVQGLEAAWKIETFADLCEWCSTRMCETVEDFFGKGRGRYEFDMQHDQDTFRLESPDFQNDTIVLSCFSHSFREGGRRKQSFGLVLTSRKLLRNVIYAVYGQASDGLFVAADGTYRLHYGHWTLVAVGTYRCRYNKRRYSKNFVPWAYMFVRTEHEAAYTKLFRTLVDVTRTFFGAELTARFGSLDHSESIANAFVAVWPQIVLLDCYAHVARKCRENSHRLNEKAFFESNVEVNIQQMHHARSSEQFEAITKLCLQYWRKKKEVQYADWFEKVYLDNRWLNWYTTCAIPGIQPSQNALESHNGVIKKAGITMKKAKTGVVLNDSIPGILTVAAQDAPDRPYSHCCQGPLPSKMVAKAHLHVEENAYYELEGPGQHKSYLFNVSQYMPSKKTPGGRPITKARVDRYIEGKQGYLHDKDTVLDITTTYQSLHEVEILLRPGENNSELQVKLDPIISRDTIMIIRSAFRCDCKSFWSTGWICSHVIAAMSLEKYFKLSEAVAILPTTKASGGQRKVRSSLQSPYKKSKTFTKPYLLGILQEDPLYVKGWEISQEFDVEVDGISHPRQHISGVIIGFTHENGIYKWRVDYSDEDILYYACEDMVDIIIASHNLGLDVTRSANSSASESSDSVDDASQC